jgi:hypothetical protein
VVHLLIAATGRFVRIQTAFGRIAPEFVPQGAIATLEVERHHVGQRMVDDEGTANLEGFDFCS